MKNFILQLINNDEGLYEGNLQYYFKKIFFASSAENYYHNFNHTTHVACVVYEGAKDLKYHTIVGGKRRLRALLIAALFHDYGHSGKMGNDSREIAFAIASIQHFLLEEDEDLLPEIGGLIGITQFPHVECGLSLAGQLLRDADISQVFADNWMQQVIFGLPKEMGIAPVEFLEKEIDFLSSITFYTAWAKDRFGKLIPKRIKEIEAIISILKD